MKKILPILLALIIAIISFQCNLVQVSPPCCEYPIGTLDINIKAFYANKPLIMNQVSDYNGKKIRLTKLQFFLNSDINYFDNSDTTTTNLDRIPIAHLLNFTGLVDSAKAATGITLNLNAGMGDKTIMIFDVGVAKKLNAKSPKDFTPSEPLFDTTNYRTDWKSFVFVKLEGVMDKDGDGIFETQIKLHTGTNDLIKTIKFNKSYKIEALRTTKFNAELNLNELLKNIDLANLNSAQQTAISPAAKQLMDNFSIALILK
jgi:hypothetical protein